MRSKSKKRKQVRRKTKLGLPDLDHAKAAVLASLHSPESQRSYRHAIDEFVGWYCSEPRLSFNKTVVTRYRIHLEDRRLAPGTTNVRLAAVRRLADEAAEAGLLSPELAAGIRRVKGSISNNVGPCQALFEDTSFFSPKRVFSLSFSFVFSLLCIDDHGSFVICRSVSVRPNHLSDQNFDHDYYFDLPLTRKRGAQSSGR
jgi:hypothetical protein